MLPAVFLDRDGVIIKNRSDYVRNWDDVEIFPQALTALNRLSALPYQVVIVTNQSVVGRQLISESCAQEINERLVAKIQEAGGRIERVYMCPHAPWDSCECRKPMPGLFNKAASELSIDMSHSFMIGDTVNDLIAAKRAGVGSLVLVLTGLGKQESLQTTLKTLQPLPILYDSLLDAVAGLPAVDFLGSQPGGAGSYTC